MPWHTLATLALQTGSSVIGRNSASLVAGHRSERSVCRWGMCDLGGLVSIGNAPLRKAPRHEGVFHDNGRSLHFAMVGRVSVRHTTPELQRLRVLLTLLFLALSAFTQVFEVSPRLFNRGLPSVGFLIVTGPCQCLRGRKLSNIIAVSSRQEFKQPCVNHRSDRTRPHEVAHLILGASRSEFFTPAPIAELISFYRTLGPWKGLNETLLHV